MSREEIANVLDEIALLLELKGDNPFKIKAYKNGADTVRAYPDDIVELARTNQLNGIKGIGEALRDKLHELANTGILAFHQNLKAEFPASIFELFDLQGLGAKKIKTLYDTLHVSSIADLQSACEEGKVAELAGFGEKTQKKLLEAIAARKVHNGLFTRIQVDEIAGDFYERLQSDSAVHRVAICGSYRRGKEIIGDLDFLVATSEPSEITKYFTTFPHVKNILAVGDTKASVLLENGLQCDLRAVSTAQFPFALQYFTGSKEHNVALRALAQQKGYSLNEYGLDQYTGEIHDEAEIYQALGLDYIPPELRENQGEIDAASKHSLPRLIEKENLRGTFHNHTNASDGKNTLTEMLLAARELGLSYLGISDHSRSSPQANGLTADRLLKQIHEVKTHPLNDEFFRAFAGLEVDIHKDGSLDYDNSLLAQLDFAVASVHHAFTLSEDEMTARIIKAMENPHVTMIGHLTGRLLLKRDSYQVNHKKIIEAAAETRTIIELNCNPKRLDMDWRWWKLARDKGVLCSINPDAHATAQLQFLHYGILAARKGWLRREDVINTKSLAEISAFLATPKHLR